MCTRLGVSAKRKPRFGLSQCGILTLNVGPPSFPKSENGCHQISDPEKCDQMYESLVRINSNVYKEKFPRAKDTSFTGVTVEECRMLLGTGNMQQMDEEKKGLWKTLMQRFSSKPEDASVEKPEK
ncbi:hypothetical protein QTP70_026563 [Hemibagrus guttatus]|uniref:Mitochondrial nucleoid factor 1 n=1 Tax=Hemibagrus guttatus TaxID=175788 RepID=A0AAE0RKP0_9TELE|nr:hypothetical protein QTP70_026563 [Hemibagrus guttatus]